ncbi:hypothetical protein [Streptomyces sp. NBC_00299]|nr:hypothetical protein [Streptomyces sp. NBC_00299]
MVHHFGSQGGPRREVDEYVLAVFEAMRGGLTGGAGLNCSIPVPERER